MGRVKTATLGGETCNYEEIYAYGEAWSEKMHNDHKNFIRVDHRLKSLALLTEIIREAMHIQRPRATKKTLDQDSKELARLLHRLGYRRTEE